MKQIIHCRCGHARAAHEHYRRGTDCALCPGDCPRYRPVLDVGAVKTWLRGGRGA
jgi:hypothetical protein